MKLGIRSFIFMILLGLINPINSQAQQYDASVVELLSDIGVFESDNDEFSSTETEISLSNPIISTPLAPISLLSSSLNPSYTDREYQYKLSLIRSAVPLHYNALVRSYIETYTVRHRASSEEILGLSTIYFPIFERYLLENNLPTELKYLAIPESALLNNRFSSAGAAGLWQLMPNTARNFGLTVNEHVDERLDPYRASEAAAKYLKMLYNKYHDWTLVIAAYNCGDNALDQAIKKAGGVHDFWAITDFLPRETRSYVPLFIACSYWTNYYFDHYLTFRKPENPYLYSSSDVVNVKGGLSLQTVAQYTGVKIEQLVELNPALRQKVVPVNYNTYQLRLPLTEVFAFQNFQEAMYAFQQTNPLQLITITDTKIADKPAATTTDKAVVINYTVKDGDVLGHIADWYDCNSSDLKRWNNLKGDIVQKGDKLVVYVKQSQLAKYKTINTNSFAANQRIDKTKDAQNTNKKPQANSVAIQTYTVKKGDTLSEIIQKFPKSTIKDIQRLNNIKDKDNLVPGQKLKVKAG